MDQIPNCGHLNTNKHFLFTIEVQCLKDHVPTVDKSFGEVMDILKTPPSQIDPNAVGEFIDQQKLVLKNVDQDVKDAKRRISAAKGPRRKVVPNVEANNDSESDWSLYHPLPIQRWNLKCLKLIL